MKNSGKWKLGGRDTSPPLYNDHVITHHRSLGAEDDDDDIMMGDEPTPVEVE